MNRAFIIMACATTALGLSSVAPAQSQSVKADMSAAQHAAFCNANGIGGDVRIVLTMPNGANLIGTVACGEQSMAQQVSENSLKSYPPAR